MAHRETKILKQIRMLASSYGARLFRNNLYPGYGGEAIRISEPGALYMDPGDVLVRQARVIRPGFPNGSSDLIGFVPIEVTEEMIGKKIAVFMACEVKSPGGKVTKAQDNFIGYIRAQGGVSLVAFSPEDALAVLEDPINHLNGEGG